MSIDMNINEMFSEKNQTIFFNKLIMDLDNNSDIFKLAAKNKVILELATLLSSLKRVYDKYLVQYDENKLKELLSKTKTSLLEDINVIIDDKTATNSNFINSNRNMKINKAYLKEYHKQIDDGETSFEESIKLSIHEHTEINLYDTLIKLYPCRNEEMQQDIINVINNDCCSKLVSKIVSEGKHRSMTLKNMSEETYQKYLELNKNSDNSYKSSKIKSKKDN